MQICNHTLIPVTDDRAQKFVFSPLALLSDDILRLKIFIE